MSKYAMSARSITIAIQGVAIIGLAAAVVFTARSAEMAAAAAAQLVQNVDEPARNLYQQEVTISNGIDFVFSAVPTGKTLRITQASCFFDLSDSNGVSLVSVISGTGVNKTDYISTAVQGNTNVVVANSEINLYSSAGSKPYIEISINTSSITYGSCTLSGYFVTN